MNSLTQSSLKARQKTDVRVVRTLKSIETAFFEALQAKDYDAITIADILAIANINRTTFYKYYNNKNELAHAMVTKLEQELFIPLLNKRFNLSWEEFSKEIPKLFDINQQKIKLLWRIDTPTIHLKKDLYSLVKKRYITERIANNKADNIQLQAHLYACLWVAMTEFSIESDSDLTPDEYYHNLEQVSRLILT